MLRSDTLSAPELASFDEYHRHAYSWAMSSVAAGVITYDEAEAFAGWVADDSYLDNGSFGTLTDAFAAWLAKRVRWECMGCGVALTLQPGEDGCCGSAAKRV